MKSSRHKFLSSLLPSGLGVVLRSLAGIVFPVATLNACAGQDPSSSIDEIGGEASMLVTAPVSGCLEAEWSSSIRSGSSQFTVAAGVEEELVLDRLPLTAVTLSARLFPTADCSGEALYVTDPLGVVFSPASPVAFVTLLFLGNGRAVIDARFEGQEHACRTFRNVALNADRSSDGWAGGQSKPDLVDRTTSYTTWSRGLAFPGGKSRWNGTPCGLFQVTVELEEAVIERARFWHHGFEHVPPESDYLEVSLDGVTWQQIADQRTLLTDLEDCSAGFCSVPTEHVFAPVAARFVRHNVDNCATFPYETTSSHGWYYEAEALTCAD